MGDVTRAPTPRASELLPVFPLGTVLLPRAPLSLHVFEERYRALVHDVRNGAGEFGVVLIERGSEVGGGETRFGTGTVARIEHAEPLADGRWLLAARGGDAFEVVEWLPDDPYPRATVVRRPEVAPTVAAAEARDRVEVALRELGAVWARVDPRAADVDLTVPGDPSLAAWHVASRLGVGPLDAQRILQAPDVETRLDLVEAAVTELTALVRWRGPDPG